MFFSSSFSARNLEYSIFLSIIIYKIKRFLIGALIMMDHTQYACVTELNENPTDNNNNQLLILDISNRLKKSNQTN